MQTVRVLQTLNSRLDIFSNVLEKKKGIMDYHLQRILSRIYVQCCLTCLSVILLLWWVRTLSGRELLVFPF